MILIDEHDNGTFISNIELISRNKLNEWKPNYFFITKIDNWFDDKWLNYSGNIMQGLSIWKEELTFPPFHPNRVIRTDLYKNNKQIQQYELYKQDYKLHIIQPSIENLKFKVHDYLVNAMLLWYSGNTNTNDVGAGMIYYIKGNEHLTFYFSLHRKSEWGAHKCIGQTKKEIEELLQRR